MCNCRKYDHLRAATGIHLRRRPGSAAASSRARCRSGRGRETAASRPSPRPPAFCASIFASQVSKSAARFNHSGHRAARPLVEARSPPRGWIGQAQGRASDLGPRADLGPDVAAARHPVVADALGVDPVDRGRRVRPETYAGRRQPRRCAHDAVVTSLLPRRFWRGGGTRSRGRGTSS